MESTTLTGPLLYLLITWGVVTAIFLFLLLRGVCSPAMKTTRSFSMPQEEHMPGNSASWWQRSTPLSKPLMGTGQNILRQAKS